MSLFLVSEPILFFQLSIIFKGSWKACDHRHLCLSCLMNKIALSLPDVRKQGHFHFRAVMDAADLFLVQVRSKLSILPCHLERYTNVCKGRQGWCLKHFFPRGTVQPPYIMSHHLLGAITVQLQGPPLLLGPTDPSPLSPAGSSPFHFFLLKLSSLSFPLWDASHYLSGFSNSRKNHCLPLTSAFRVA